MIQTAEARGLMSMGFHCLCAQNAAGEHWLTGVGFTWGPLFTRMAQQVMDGTWKSTNDVGNYPLARPGRVGSDFLVF